METDMKEIGKMVKEPIMAYMNIQMVTSTMVSGATI
jgi:hypothetical protein